MRNVLEQTSSLCYLQVRSFNAVPRESDRVTAAKLPENVARVNRMLQSWMKFSVPGSIVVVTDGPANYSSDLSKFRFLILEDGPLLQYAVLAAY